MSVTLDHITRSVDGIPTIRDVSLTLDRGTLSVPRARLTETSRMAGMPSTAREIWSSVTLMSALPLPARDVRPARDAPISSRR